jgi:nucleotide-binding universal stress UspA family protein
MKTLIIPTDFSPTADNAVDTAIQLARLANYHVEFVHVINAMEFYVPIEPITGISMYSPEVLNPFFNEQMSEAKRKMILLQEKATKVGVMSTFRVNYAPLIEEIHKIEQEKECELIVMGTKGSSGLDEVFIGSNTQRVVRFSKKPVLAIKDKLQWNTVKKVVFVSDFDEQVLNALNTAIRVFGAAGASVEALFINTPNYFEDSISSEERIKYMVSKSEKPEMPIHVFNDFSVEEGVSAFCVRNQVDAIAITTHGYTGLRKLFNANITEAVVNHINLPVLSLPFLA